MLFVLNSTQGNVKSFRILMRHAAWLAEALLARSLACLPVCLGFKELLFKYCGIL